LGGLILVLVILGFFGGSSHALDVTLAWDPNPEPNISFYILYYDTDQGAPYEPDIGDYVEAYSVDGKSTWHIGPFAPPIWLPSSITRITLKLPSSDRDFFFAVRAFDVEGRVSAYSREIAVIAPAWINPPYNRGWAITSGELQGFLVFYNTDTDPVTPTLGSPEDVPPFNLPGLVGIGTPWNLQPSGAVFTQPVWVEFPVHSYSGTMQPSLGFCDDTGWILAWDGETGQLTHAGEGWLDGAPAYNTGEDPHTVSVVVKHFTGVQAAVPAGQDDTTGAGGTGGGGCFIATLAGK
jgi:hypothetical protein